MAANRAVFVLLCVVLALVGMLVVGILSDNNESERWVVAALLLVMAPVAMHLKTLHSRMGQIGANVVSLDATGVRIRLVGALRRSKGLPEIQDMLLPWSEVTGVTSDRRKFSYRSVIPFEYPLDVYTILTTGGAIPFTKECVPGAAQAAQAISSRVGRNGQMGAA